MCELYLSRFVYQDRQASQITHELYAKFNDEIITFYLNLIESTHCYQYYFDYQTKPMAVISSLEVAFIQTVFANAAGEETHLYNQYYELLVSIIRTVMFYYLTNLFITVMEQIELIRQTQNIQITDVKVNIVDSQTLRVILSHDITK